MNQKKLIIILFILNIGLTTVCAAERTSQECLNWSINIPFRRLGYRTPILIQGFRAYKDFHFPWCNSFDLKKSSIRIKLKFSPVLNSNSVIRVMIEKIPLKTILVSSPDLKKSIEIPLNSLQDVNIGKFLDVELMGNFIITGDRCIDESSGNLWAVVFPDSELHIVQKTLPDSIEDFFRCAYKPLNVVIKTKDRSEVEALCKIAGLIGAVCPLKTKNFEVFSKPVPGFNIIIGNYENDLSMMGTNLYVTPRGVNLLSSSWLPELIGKKYKLVFVSQPNTKYDRQISFGDLGLQDKIMKGIGDLTTVVSFSPLEFGGWPDNLSCTIVYSHTPVAQKERAFLKIRLNSVLVAAHEITGEGATENFSFELPCRYLQAQNSLEITFSYYLNRGDCHGSFPEMEVALYSNSFFTIGSRVNKPPLALSSFFSLMNGKGGVIAEPMKVKEMTPTLRMLALAGTINGIPPKIGLLSKDELKNNLYNYYLIQAAPSSMHLFNPIIDLEPSFKIFNPLTKKVLLELESTDPVSALQVFYGPRDKPFLIYSSRTQKEPDFQHLQDIIINGTRANACIFNHQHWHVMEIGEKLRVVYPHKKDLGYYWTQYKTIIVVFLGFVVLAFLFYLYKRLSGEDAK